MRPPKNAFTLLELTVAMVILALVASCVYGVLRGTLEVAAGLSEQQTRQEQVDGLVELCRRTFRMLPAEASLEGRARKVDGMILPELIFRNSPDSLAWERVEDFSVISALGLRPQRGGLFNLSLLRTVPPEDVTKDAVALAGDGEWLTLVPDLKKVAWRFFDSRSGLWLDDLPAGSLRPDAVELTLWLAEDENTPLRVVFWVVPMARQFTVQSLPRGGT